MILYGNNLHSATQTIVLYDHLQRLCFLFGVVEVGKAIVVATN